MIKTTEGRGVPPLRLCYLIYSAGWGIPPYENAIVTL